MRNCTDDEKDILRSLYDDLKAKADATRAAKAIYEQAVTAHAYLCQIPPREDIALHDGDGGTYDWMVRLGSLPDGQPVLKSLLQFEAERNAPPPPLPVAG